jgi:hypothetical protein
VRVVAPTPRVEFKLINDPTTGIYDSVLTNGNGNNTSGANVTAKAVTYNATEDKYYATLGLAPATVLADKVSFKLDLFTENVVPPTTLKLPYTFIKTDPTISVTKTDVVDMALITGVAFNDGSAPTALNNGKYEVATKASGIANLNVTETFEQVLTVAGTYIYDLTLGGIRKVITVVVQPYPALKDVVVNVGTAKADMFGSRVLVPSTAKAISFTAAASNLPTGTLYYTLSLGTTATGATANLRGASFNKTSATLATNGTITATEVFKPLDLTKPIGVQIVDDGATKPSDFAFATNADLLNKVRFIQVNIFRRTNNASFDPLDPLYALTHVGHQTIEIWYGPNNVPASIISTATTVTGSLFNTEIDLKINSDTAGKAYFLAIPSANAKAPTLSQLIAQAAYPGENNVNVVIVDSGILTLSLVSGVYTHTLERLTGFTAGTAYTIYYAVIGDDNVSAVFTKTVTTGANLTGNTLTVATVAATGEVTAGAAPAGSNSQQYLVVPVANSTNVAAVLLSLTAATTAAELQSKLRTITTVNTLTFAALSSTSTDLTPGTGNAVNTDVLVIVEITAASVIVKYSVQTISGLS